MTESKFRLGQQHPDEYRRDLNPHATEGHNYGTIGTGPIKDARTAYEVKDVHRRLQQFSDAELKQIPVLSSGTRLEQGAVYVDLKDTSCKEIKALGNMEAGPDNWYVPKSEVDYQLWNRLIGVENPERRGEADER
ncbi:MAG: hypothetical protein HY329_21470 [Chloroflexi bacterium]|nr:hypothetical protein [Chloroflexota bacterium]